VSRRPTRTAIWTGCAATRGSSSSRAAPRTARTPRGRFVISVMTAYLQDDRAGEAFIGDVTRAESRLAGGAHHPGLEVGNRIDRAAVATYLEVQMGATGVPRGTDLGDRLALLDLVPLAHQQPAGVCV